MCFFFLSEVDLDCCFCLFVVGGKEGRYVASDASASPTIKNHMSGCVDTHIRIFPFFKKNGESVLHHSKKSCCFFC